MGVILFQICFVLSALLRFQALLGGGRGGRGAGGGAWYRTSKSQQSRKNDAQKLGFLGACIPSGCRGDRGKTYLERAELSDIFAVVIIIINSLLATC